MNTCGQPNEKNPVGIVERYGLELNSIIGKDAKVEVIASGFEWVEGPVWIESQKMLLVSDVPKNQIYKWTAAKGKELYLESSGYTGTSSRGGESGSNGLMLNEKNQLVLCQHGDRRVALMNSPVDLPEPNFTTLINNYRGKKFNSPNDLALKSNGDIYFTDPPYGLEKNMDDPLKELNFQGVYRISKNGTVTLLTDTITRPNGIAIFPGEETVLVANSDPQKPHWYAFDLNKEGNFVNGRIFLDGTKIFKKDNRVPDGLKIDNKGNVFATGPGGVWIFDREGKALGRIKLNVTTSNCAFANNFKTLFITADHHLLKIELRK